MITKEELLYIIKNKSECEYVEYKDSFRNDDEIGEYISAISNGATLRKQEFGYLIWGVENLTRNLTNTKFDYEKEVNGGENYAHYLSRNLNPKIDIEFKEESFDGNRVVYLEIPAASDIIADYKNVRYVRVGSSKEEIRRYPKIEKKLWNILNGDEFSVSKEESPRQDLTFRIFKIYLDEYHVIYTDDNLFSNNHMLTKDGKFNYIAFMLSDQFDVSLKISKFAGNNKQSDFVFRKEFGLCCVLKAIDDLTEYMEKIENKVRSYFDPGKVSRRDEFLFDKDAFREAYVNAVLHNDWSTRSGPSVFLFNNHLEVYSHGSPLSIQTLDEFLLGKSKPINPDLAKVFMKFENFEESGKGVNTILNKYGKNVFEFASGDTSFTVSFPFNELALEDNVVNNVVNNVVKNVVEKDIINLLKKDNSLSANNIAEMLRINIRTIQRYLKVLADNNIIKRVGRTKAAHWEVLIDELTGIENNVHEIVVNNVVNNVVEKDIINLLKKDSSLSAIKIAEMLRINIRTIQRHLKILIDNNIIKRVGRTKAAHWEVIK